MNSLIYFHDFSEGHKPLYLPSKQIKTHTEQGAEESVYKVTAESNNWLFFRKPPINQLLSPVNFIWSVDYETPLLKHDIKFLIIYKSINIMKAQDSSS